MSSKKSAKRRQPVFLNAGCGSSNPDRLPALFRSWKQVKVDIDPSVKPDLVTSITDLSGLADDSVDAVWSAHCVEHLYAHEVPQALGEFRRVLREDGFACIVVPDLQAIAQWIAEDRLNETIYRSPAGDVTAHEMIWGYGPALAQANTAMAHHCGFTPTPLIQCLAAAGFGEIMVRRKSSLELVGLALCRSSEGAAGNAGKSAGSIEATMARLGL